MRSTLTAGRFWLVHCLCAVAVTSCASTALRTEPSSAEYSLSPDALAAHVAWLSSDDLAGREPGTEGDKDTTAYLVSQFRALGAVPLAAPDYRQSFEISLDEATVQTANVVATVRGTREPERYVLFIAHHDGQGLCAESNDRICNSAVDNASGTAVLIEMARQVAARPLPISIIFLASGAEEEGLLGAKAFIEDPPVPLAQIEAAFGLDTVAARGYSDTVGILGEGLTSLDPLVRRAAARSGRHVDTAEGTADFYRRSDHAVFADAGVPAIMVTGLFAPGEDKFVTSAYAANHYHRPSDEAGPTIDYRGAAADGALLLEIAALVADAETPPRWTENSIYQRP